MTKKRDSGFLISIFIIFFTLHFTPYTLHLAYSADAGRIQLSVPSPEQLKAGGVITFQVLAVNEGSTAWNTGVYSASIDIYDTNKVFKVKTESTAEGPLVAPGESALFFLAFKVPENFGGQYFYKANLKYSKRIISTSDYYTFSVISLISSATIAITNTIGEQKFDSNFKVICQIKNTGETNRNFPVLLEIKAPGEVIKIPVKTISLGPDQSSTIQFECSIPVTAPDGIYTAVASVYDRLEDEKPVQKYNEATQEFKIVDTTPTIQFLNLGLSAVKGEEISLKVKVIDDRGIRDVRISYQLPGMPEKKTQKMNMISGTKEDGIWMFKTAAFTETGKFVFTIEATDTKSQISKAEYQTTVVTQ